MTTSVAPTQSLNHADTSNWQKAFSLSALTEKGSKIVKIEGKQIVLFLRDEQVYACNNRCPHEGFPLKEGTLSGKCILTCNWHNWKFDLRSGDNLYGGDQLRTYPVRIDGDEIWLNVVDAPEADRIKQALDNLRASFDRHQYDQMAREIARLEKAGGDALDAVRATIHWTYDKFEFGMGSTHSHMAAADWLHLREERATTPATQLMPLHELIAHMAWDTRREATYPYTKNQLPWNEEGFIEAIETENEETAVAHLRGALSAGLSWNDLERCFARATLAHYIDFGHGAIYVIKTAELIERLGPTVMEPLLLALTRSLVMGTREDLIPEFRAYAAIKAGWKSPGDKIVSTEDFEGLGPEPSMTLAAQAAQQPSELYHVLFEMNCRSLLRFDLAQQALAEKSVSQNCTWLDVTHEITFANSARQLCGKYPELWHDALLQMCCFFGRNGGFQDPAIVEKDWHVEDSESFLNNIKDGLFDHGQFEYIVTAHLVKMTYAVADEISVTPDAPWKNTLLAGLNRFLNSPLKRRHSLRTEIGRAHV